MKTESPATPEFVVGVGASAGGLEAIEKMFDRMPVDTGMAFVIVQHLSPDFKSVMDEVLARRTQLPIFQVTDGIPVERDAIYLMPPRTEMVISNGRLLLTEKDRKALTLPIDHFFRSLAQDCGRSAIAVVLSGTGSDGSRGVAEVHESGGLVISQQEETAKFDGMPRSARDTGVVDLFLAPEEIPGALLSCAKNPNTGELNLSGGAEVGQSGMRRVFSLIRDAYGLDFGHYKLNTVVRRIERRLLLTSMPKIDEYAKLLAEDREELDSLYRDLLIGVTRFFRDPDSFERLAKEAVDPLIDSAKDGDELRVWVAGCATGEEAYSIAMLFDQAMERKKRRAHVKVFATDVHHGSLEVASQGVFPSESLSEMSRERIAKYFNAVKGGFRIKPHLRQMIVFAPHNLVRDAPFTKIDLITCRNLLIYLQPSTQKKVISLFHFGLKTGGVLFLGPSESPGEVSAEFEAVDHHWKIYRKRRDIRLPHEMRLQLSPGGPGLRPSGLPNIPASAAPTGDTLLLSTYDALLTEVMPPSVLISEEGKLLHTFGDAGDFFQSEQGRFTSDALERLSVDLRVLVATAIRKVLKEERAVTYSRVTTRKHSGEKTSVDLRVSPVIDERLQNRSVLVQFAKEEDLPADSPSTGAFDTGTISVEQIAVLETELRYTKENLQATIEELETSNEELQATNEELVASNEELQSTNEELHSVNEELYTINAEHQNKIVQLSELTRDMDNLLQSTEVDTIFLDSELKIRKFTQRGSEKFNFLPQDTGRRIDSFTHRIQCQDLTGKIERVIRLGDPHEEEVTEKGGGHFLLRILPYADSGAKQDAGASTSGALLTLVNITKLKKASEALEESLKQRDRFLAMLSHELRNPLATILHATHLLTRSGESTEESLAVIKRQSQHMATLLDDLLDVTRVSQGKIHLQKRPFNLLSAVRGAMEAVQSRFEAREQAIVAEFPDGPIWVLGSEPRILQVLSNLLINASKYSGQGERVELHVEEDPDRVLISVRDNGVGISPEQLDKVFDLFVQSNRTLDRADGGLGVGLTLVKSLVELHEGVVEVRSEGEGRGSEFVVTLPTCDAPEQEESTDAEPAGGRSDVRHVVLVEDNIDASKMLAFLLEDSGYQVSIANDGARGLEMINEAVPDAAVIDIGLPGMSGYDLARDIRHNHRLNQVYLIALTGYGQASDRAEAISSGFDEHLVKPVDPQILSHLLARSRG